MDYAKESLRLHGEWKGKIEVISRVPVNNKDDLSLAYTPGVAQPCLEIQKDMDKSYELTRRHNLVAVITDGTAVLGLGDIGPEAGMPVMEGKCALFKAFADVDAFPICIRSKDVDEIVRTIYLISGSFGGINLEDIAAPRCFEIERRLKEICDIPVFHDDQHGTAIVVGTAILNALRVVDKRIDEIKMVINGAGSAGIAIGKHLMNLGVKHLKMVDRCGILCEGADMNPAQAQMAAITNPERFSGTLADALRGADVFVGVSRAALEAMSCRRPVILCGNEGYGGIVRAENAARYMATNYCCRDYPGAAEEDLRRDVLRLLNMAPGQRAALGEDGRRIVLEDFSEQAMARETAGVYELAMHPRRSVVVSGYYGYRNLGDDAILEMICRDFAADSDITVLSRRPRETARYYGVNTVHRFRMLRVLRAIRNCDLRSDTRPVLRFWPKTSEKLLR